MCIAGKGLRDGTLDDPMSLCEFCYQRLDTDKVVVVIHHFAEDGWELCSEIFQNECMQVPANDALVIETKDWRTHHPAYHVGRFIVIVAIMTAILGEGSNQGNAFGAARPPAALGIVCRAGRNIA